MMKRGEIAVNLNLYVLEPNLKGFIGHYAEFVFALRNACLSDDISLVVHADPESDSIFEDEAKIQIAQEAPRTNQFLGEWRILWKHIKQNDPCLILTANAKHVLLVTLFSLFLRKKPNRCFFYFHWIENKFQQKLFHQLALITKTHSIAIAPTEGIAQSLRSKKWKQVYMVPYPAVPAKKPPFFAPFSKVLIAGAARMNKGLPLITELAELLEKENSHSFELWIQISPKHATKHGSQESHYVDRLRNCGYTNLHLCEQAPKRDEYMERFKGALVLALYDQKKFAHGVSGIVLDALLAGTPIITTKNTWAGNQVEQFDAGIAISSPTAKELLGFIDQALNRWSHYSKAASESSKKLRQLHSPNLLLQVIKNHCW